MFTELTKPRTVSEVLDEYRRAKDALEHHCGAIKEALERAYAAGVGRSTAFYAEQMLREHLRELREETWRALINASGAEKILSVKRLDQFERWLKTDAPEPSEEAIYELLAGGGAQELFAEMVREAFDFLRPGAKWYGNRYKTNLRGRAAVGKKIILERIIEVSQYYTHIYHQHRRHLQQVDKIFHLLDGKPFPYDEYASPLVAGLAQTSGETAYFKWRRYRNGNLHLEFLRDDLLKKFNQLAGQLVDPAVGDGIAV
ncbi:MAG: DUF4942 domain-containing protein [Chloroflexota bacterium]|jgi:hypothetical protein